MSREANLNIDDEIVRIRARLHALDSERIALEARLDELACQPSLLAGAENAPSNINVIAAVTSASSSAAKVSLFRRLFAGRVDVFPIRWENRKTGRGGYAPPARTNGRKVYAISRVSDAASAHTRRSLLCQTRSSNDTYAGAMALAR